jgi:hypothetical protein
MNRKGNGPIFLRDFSARRPPGGTQTHTVEMKHFAFEKRATSRATDFFSPIKDRLKGREKGEKADLTVMLLFLDWSASLRAYIAV